jgi:hypothetical protein
MSAATMTVILIQHSEPQHLRQKVIDPSDEAEITQRREERRDESLPYATMVAKNWPCLTPGLNLRV